MKETKHIPVLLEETIEGLHLEKGMTVVDATLGGGGHAGIMLAKVSPTGTVIAIDTDASALVRFKERSMTDEVLRRAIEDGRLVTVHGNYSELSDILDAHTIGQVDAILADLGYSSDQIEGSERGFGFQNDGPLDMRLDQETRLTAWHIVNEYPEGKIVDILFEYADETEARRIAHAIVVRRTEKTIDTTAELAAVVKGAYPKRKQALSRIHPATKTFQALRIAVNEEFEHLDSFLGQALERLRKGGRMAVIAFHSGEDVRVKRFMKEAVRGCVCPPNFPVCRCGQEARGKGVTKKPITPKDEELAKNPRARSAKLRILEKV